MRAPHQSVGSRLRQVRSRARFMAMLGGALLPAVVLAGDVSPLGVFASNPAIQPPTSAQDGTPGNDDLGATGHVPKNESIDPRLLAEFRDTQSLVPDAGARAQVPSGTLGIPGIPLDAYHRAERAEAALNPGCGVDWAVLASIGRIESNHARDGAVDANGTTVTPILGPVLNGQNGNAAILDSDGGRYDGDTTWDRAVGPMQFIPSTWRTYATDGHGDGTASPHNVYDATQAAAKYLCAEGGDLRDPAQLAMAVFRYNHSDSYVQTVLAWAAAYRSGVTTLPDHIGPVTPVQPGPGAPPPNVSILAGPAQPPIGAQPAAAGPPPPDQPAPSGQPTTVTGTWGSPPPSQSGPPPAATTTNSAPPPNQPASNPPPPGSSSNPPPSSPPPSNPPPPGSSSNPPPPGPGGSTCQPPSSSASPTPGATPAPTTSSAPPQNCPTPTGQASPSGSPQPATSHSPGPAK